MTFFQGANCVLQAVSFFLRLKFSGCIFLIGACRLHCWGCTIDSLTARFNLKLPCLREWLSTIETAKSTTLSFIHCPSHFLLLAVNRLHHMVGHLRITKLGKQCLLVLNRCIVGHYLIFLWWLACDSGRYFTIVIFRAISCVTVKLIVRIDLLGFRVQ